MKHTVEFTAGSIIGASHRKKGGNNQDSYTTYCDDTLFIGLISDGCSNKDNPYSRSDVGSALLCEFTTSSILSLRHQIGNETFFQTLFLDVCDRIALHLSLIEQPERYASKYLQATLLGCIICDNQVWIFSCGDGLYFLNGTQYTILPQEGNSPVYLAYKFTPVLPNTLSSETLDRELRFHVQQSICMDEVDSVLLGSDGLQELIDAHDQIIHVRNEPIGEINQWWTKDLYFRNPVSATNWLRMMNEGGYCKDDVTLIGLRKKKEVPNG
ncbi:protein phosphatase 2C domain-containing protein [Patescibacteria group bacterium]|nr:protein phosphatase 2C domain-containing protein [Patescibacteria group bacterium]